MNDEFDWDAYYLDTRRLSLDARGAWMDCLCEMRRSVTRGRISEPLPVFATMFGSTVLKAQRVLDEISARGVADYFKETNGSITIINRRMFRKWQESQDATLRQAKRRHPELVSQEKHESVTEANANKNGHLQACHGIVTNEAENALLVVEKNVKNEEGKEKRKNGVLASRIPGDFPLTDEMSKWALINCPGLSLASAHDNFVEYWTNNTTAKAFKVDWMLTWRKGMKLALGWQQKNQLRHSVGKAPEIEAPEPSCQRCLDQRTTFVQRPGGKEWELMQVDCPDCSEVAISA